ncbi:hypothetical protein, partial [Methylobacterium soli]|uniref:hypothetical protein n=1 Tax=Methylobacterium soli TaxID=553447 RepID=UPI001EE1D5F0
EVRAARPFLKRSQPSPHLSGRPWTDNEIILSVIGLGCGFSNVVARNENRPADQGCAEEIAVIDAEINYRQL